MSTEKSFRFFLDIPKITGSILLSFVPLIGILFFHWDGAKFLAYFIAEIAIGFIFNFFFVLFNTEINKEVKEKGLNSNNQISRVRLFFYIIVAKAIIFFSNLIIYSILLAGVLFFLSLLMYGEQVSFLRILLEDTTIIKFILVSYTIEFIVSYILLGNRHNITLSKLQFSTYSPLLILFVTVILGSVFYSIIKSPLVFAFSLIIIRIVFIVIIELLKGVFAYLKFRFPDLKVESNLS